MSRNLFIGSPIFAKLARLTALAGLSSVFVGVALAPGAARACGGLFCDGPPPNPFAPLPVAQNGENVVFSIDKDPAGGATTMTAQIQILYTGDAAKFSWVVPVDAMPTLGVGTDQLFTSLLGATQPQFQAQYAVAGSCLPDAYDNKGGFGAGDAGIQVPGSASGSGGSTAVGGPTVTVTFQGAVGPYDAAVLQSTDPTALKTWLTTNGYVVDDNASSIIDQYVRENKFFVALKLMNGMGTTSIQPIVLTFYATEPCIPLRLTAIAANPDMPVRLWVFADGRVVPKNFFEVTIDEARIDWLSSGSNYASLSNSLLSKAADEAGGDAFVTEYAGPATIAAGLLWSPGRFDLSGLQAAQTPPAYIQALLGLGLAGNPQVLPLLDMYIPMPDAVKAMGISDAQFYANISFYWGQYSFPKFDLPALTAAISSTIIEPLHTAQTMIDAHAYMTRMNTFISPAEMTKDALFFATTGLGDVPLLHTATFRTMCGDMKFMQCNAPVRLELADGRMAWVRAGSTAATCDYRSYDLSGLQKLPAADKAWQRDGVGPGTVMVDNTALIEAGLAANNSAYPGEQKMFPVPTGGSPDGSTEVATSGGGGCACEVGGRRVGGLGLGAAALAAGLLVGRRRRRNSP